MNTNYINPTNRVSSRKRQIAPAVGAALINGGVSILGSLLGIGAAAKAQREQKKQIAKQESFARESMYIQQKLGDTNKLNSFNEYGNDDVEYYENGGNLNENLSPEQLAILEQNLTQSGGMMPQLPISNGGYQTQGGNLVPIGDGVEEVVGNRHNDTKIDGVSGVQLLDNGNPVAEVENKEVIADGQLVYSDRLKFDKNNSYADKMKKITKKRNKLEKEQEETPDKRKKNTIERTLASLNMAESALYQHQEEAKYKEGLKTLNKFALGGGIPPSLNRLFLLTETEGKFKGWKKNGLGEYQDPKNPTNILKDDGRPIEIDKTPYVTPGVTKDMAAYSNPYLDYSAYSNPDTVTPDTVTPTTADPVTPVIGTQDTSPKLPDTSKADKTAGIINKIGQFAPLLIDNIGNYILNKNTPKLSTPLMNRVEELETTVNVNPQLAEVRRRNKSLKDYIQSNVANSNNAKSNIIATELANGRAAEEVLAGKEAQELSLRNANAQNKQVVNNQNTALVNHQMNLEFQRQNDMQARTSQNLANLQGDINTIMTSNKLDKQYQGNAITNLMDDETGTKALLYMQDKNFMNNKENVNFLIEHARSLETRGITSVINKLREKGLV